MHMTRLKIPRLLLLAAAGLFVMMHPGTSSAVPAPIPCVGNPLITCDVDATPLADVNPVFTTHTITVTLTVINVTEFPVSGAKVFFKVTAGPNSGTTGSSSPSNAAGQTTISYVGGGTSGTDTIVICADFNSDDTTFAACNADVNDNVAETTVTKTWVENFLTGGGRIGPDKKPPTYTFGGTIGVNPSTDETQPDFIGQWEINKHTTPIAACHFDTFASLVFSGPPTQSPPSNHNTADVNMSGTCTPSGIAVAGHLHVVDVGEPGNGADTIAYTCFVGCSTLPSFSGTLTGGNLQVHQILGP